MQAFNTFIDDVFAFIITMPTSHRIAVFRDDLVFVVYLYQRWWVRVDTTQLFNYMSVSLLIIVLTLMVCFSHRLYPVDRSRVNEYGESFEESVKEHQD